MKKRDILFLISLFVVLLVLFIVGNTSSEKGDTVYIYHDSVLYKILDINTDATIDVDGTNRVVIKDGFVYMEDATCPDKLCIGQGKINSSYKSIVCLPNKVSVSVDTDSDIDTVSQ